MKPKHSIILIWILLTGFLQSYSQGNKARILTIQDAFDLAVKNSAQLKVSQQNTASARQKTEIAKLGRLPEIYTGLNYGYLSNTQAWNPSFGKHTALPNPHILTQFSVEASEVIFKGGEVANNLRKASLEEQIAVLNHEKNLEDIKFLVAAKYLDIYRLMNQRKVYTDNIKLSQERLKNILSLQKQGIVTNNDVLRTQLIISDLELALRTTNDNMKIMNQELNNVLGLDLDETLIPDSSLLLFSPEDGEIKKLISIASENNKELKIAAKEIEVSQKNMQLAEADRYPAISIFAANSLQRPYTYSIPAQDIYYNNYLAGVSITYNIGSIYQSPVKRKTAKIQIEQSLAKQTVQRQNVELAVNADLIKCNEARYELDTYTEDLKSAEENFRVVEKKYFNQLALLTDLIDATNTKIEAELKESNAGIHVVFANYQLKKSMGIL